MLLSMTEQYWGGTVCSCLKHMTRQIFLVYCLQKDLTSAFIYYMSSHHASKVWFSGK